MTQLIYANYLKDRTLDINKEYMASLLKSKFSTPSENILQRYIRYKKKNFLFRFVFWKINLRIDSLAQIHQKVIIKKIHNLFNYATKYQSSVITPFFTNNFNFRTCFYCNKDFINNFEEDTDKLVSTFQLDHFYDKGTYPYLAISFYNLIPSCPTCNSKKVKGSANCFTYQTCIAPNDDKFDFHQKVKFKLFLDEDCKNLHIKSKDDIDIPLKEQFTDQYDKYIEVFKLNERYKAHKDIVYEMITKAELYPESRLKELQNLTGIPFQQIKKDIFNLVDEEDLSKKPFSKLIKDISEELQLT